MNLVTVYSWATEPAKNADLMKQLAAAIANAAVQVLAEPETTYNHDNRIAWASACLASPDAPLKEANRQIWGVLGNVTVQGELQQSGAVPDGDLAFVVASLVNTYAT